MVRHAPSMEQFEAMVEERMQPGFRYDHPTLETFSKYAEGADEQQNPDEPLARAGFRMRREGGYIIECALRNPNGELTQVLYKPPDLSVAKLDASHAMSPVGPYDGLGGQHGFARWADYEKETTESYPESVFLTSKSPDGQPLLERSAEVVDDDVLSITSSLYNLTPELLRISLGEHLYFALPDGIADGLRIGSNEATLAEPPNLKEIMAGRTQFWPDFNGEAVVDFPDGKRIQINARATTTTGDLPVGILLWHRAGTESICIEPTLGYVQDGQGVVHNDLAAIAARRAVCLATDIRLLS